MKESNVGISEEIKDELKIQAAIEKKDMKSIIDLLVGKYLMETKNKNVEENENE